jgi:hypothetical protein
MLNVLAQSRDGDVYLFDVDCGRHAKPSDGDSMHTLKK